jgi:hypothetical protein
MKMYSQNSVDRLNRFLPRSFLREGYLSKRGARGLEIFGWPCQEIIQLEDGDEAYLLDFDRGTTAPTELRCPTSPRSNSSKRASGPVMARVVSVFGRWIVVDFEPKAYDFSGTVNVGGYASAA